MTLNDGSYHDGQPTQSKIPPIGSCPEATSGNWMNLSKATDAQRGKHQRVSRVPLCLPGSLSQCLADQLPRYPSEKSHSPPGLSPLPPQQILHQAPLILLFVFAAFASLHRLAITLPLNDMSPTSPAIPAFSLQSTLHVATTVTCLKYKSDCAPPLL